MISRISFPLASALFCAAAWAAQTTPLNVKTGEWESTSTNETTGQLPVPQEMLDKMTPEKVKREIYRPQRDFFWVPLAIALLILTLYHCLALLIAVLRAPGRKQGPKAMEIDGASHGN